MVRKNPRLRDISNILDIDRVAADAALAALDKTFRRQSKRLFKSEGSSGGAAWPALSKEYGDWKKRKFSSRKILHGPDRPGQRGGSLRRSISTKGSSQHVATVAKSGRSWVLKVGTDNPHAEYHVTGTARMPQRNPMNATDRQLRARIKAINKALIPFVIRNLKAIKGAGLGL